MESERFDTISRSLATAGTRRGIMRLLGVLPLVGVLSTFVDGEEAGAKRRGQPRGHRNDQQRDRPHDEGKQKKKPKGKGKKKRKNGRTECQPEPAAQTCAGKCGQVSNTCGTPVDCGRCTCATGCPECQTCNPATGRCIGNPAADEAPCGTGGRCLAGECVCDATSCPTGCCDGTTCRIADDNACGTEGRACTSCTSCQSCSGAGQCEADAGKNRNLCQIAGSGGGVCLDGECGAGCLDANEVLGACRAFVTSTTYTGALGGLEGADTRCQARANAANLPGTYKAWLSDSAESPATRFHCRAASCSPHGYTRVDGVTIVANDWTDLTDTSLDAAINVTELNQIFVATDTVWTYTKTDGTAGGFQNTHCLNWTDAGHDTLGDTGIPQNGNFFWTHFGTGRCDQLSPLYCFQQS
jgi:hypothetical protein